MFIPDGVIARHKVAIIPDDPLVAGCEPDCPACAQKRLIEWLESSVVLFGAGWLLAAGPTATAKWREMRDRLGCGKVA